MNGGRKKALFTRIEAALNKRKLAYRLLDEAENELQVCGRELKAIEEEEEAEDAGSSA